jgi:hypothetical protein
VDDHRAAAIVAKRGEKALGDMGLEKEFWDPWMSAKKIIINNPVAFFGGRLPKAIALPNNNRPIN